MNRNIRGTSSPTFGFTHNMRVRSQNNRKNDTENVFDKYYKRYEASSNGSSQLNEGPT